MRKDIPTGTVTFLFTDVEGSTRLLDELGVEAYGPLLAEHHRVCREAWATHGGVEIATAGDGFFVAFRQPSDALAAAGTAQAGLARLGVSVRMGVHAGEVVVGDTGYVGMEVHRAARIAAAGHGGQVLMSKQTRVLVEVDATDLGEHRLKDFPEPVGIFQLGSVRFPPLKTISNTNLPSPASTFVGRDNDISGILALLTDQVRLVTLTGPGGSGKTRLAIEAAAGLVSEFKAGVFWVGLAPLSDPALVIDTIAQTLGAREGLADHIAEREMLLVLDNFEQVIEAAPELSSLLEACSNLRLLVTSRELLRVRGEVEYPVLPLADPEAVSLFCVRTGAAPDESVRELCRALDNLPLAVELAAARGSVLSPRQLLERLSGRLDLLTGGRDAEPRQRTLRATIAWSYELLGGTEQALFTRLSVFVGGSTFEAASEVAGADLDALQSLVEKSLVRRTGERFWMLETIREFALEQLEQSSLARLRQRHAEYLAALAESADLGARRPDQPAWLDVLETEQGNWRAALEFARSHGLDALEVRFVAALGPLWRLRGYHREGSAWVDHALATEAGLSPVMRIELLKWATQFAQRRADLADARLFASEWLELTNDLADPSERFEALMQLGNTATLMRDFETARSHLTTAVEEAQALEPWALCTAQLNLGIAAASAGDADADMLFQQALENARLSGSASLIGICLTALGKRQRLSGRSQAARALLREALEILVEARTAETLAECLHEVASLQATSSRADDAARLFGAASAIVQHLGLVEPADSQHLRDDTARDLRDQLGPDRFDDAVKLGSDLTTDEAITIAIDLTADEAPS